MSDTDRLMNVYVYCVSFVFVLVIMLVGASNVGVRITVMMLDMSNACSLLQCPAEAQQSVDVTAYVISRCVHRAS